MKKTASLILLLLGTTIVQAQEIKYFDSDFVKVNDTSNAAYYSILNRDKIDTNIATKTLYYITKEKYSSTNYSNYSKSILHGVSEKWNKQGQILEQTNYINGKMDGLHLTFWDNGKPKRKDSCALGRVISGKCFDKEGNEIPYFSYLTDAEFPGGNDRIQRYIAEKVIYPPKAIDMNISGRVKVEFTITTAGAVSNVRVAQSVHRLLDAEALRVIENMPQWKPATKDGEPVRMYFTQSVNFVLN